MLYVLFLLNDGIILQQTFNFLFAEVFLYIPLMQPESLVFVVKNKYIFYKEDELKDNVQLVRARLSTG